MFTLSPSGLLQSNPADAEKHKGVDPTFISRYLLQAAIIEAYRMHHGTGRRFKVLDVGGSGSLLADFADIDLTIIDILPNDTKQKNYVQGSALAMPFADKQFDAVVSCDVLEHIPNQDRGKFLQESARVTKDLLILAAPFNLQGVREAEIAANGYYKAMTGEDHRWLLEHLQDELPHLRQAELTLEREKLNVAHFSHTALNNWQLVTRAGFLLAQEERYPQFAEHIRQFNKYYLQHIMPTDFSANGYRTFIVGSKRHEVDIKSEPDVYNTQQLDIYSLLTDSILALL